MQAVGFDPRFALLCLAVIVLVAGGLAAVFLLNRSR